MANSIDSTHRIDAVRYWKHCAPKAQRDLVIKKIAVALIALINFGALGVALFCCISYLPVPTQALLASPFIVGVLASLTYLKFPTLGIDSWNYTSFLNPGNMIGRGLTYLFFGPLMFAIQRIDWTAYHDPVCANKISKDLENNSFEKIAHEYGKHFSNLFKYGFIDKKHASELKNLYCDYKPIQYELNFWKKEHLEDCEEAKQALEQKEVFESRWLKLKETIQFPYPKKPKYQFSSKSTKIKLKLRSACCFGPPTDAARKLKAFKA